MSTKKTPPMLSLRSAVIPYFSLMEACRLEAWGR
jgi:hypothetical protein